ncbi:MAG TPA: hypothetical protein VGB70_12875 [Allosphingosinicella sp.]|jgi:predicted lipoprotein
MNAETPFVQSTTLNDSPLPRLLDLDELINAVSGPAVRAAIDRRIEQAVKHGHSRAADLRLPVKQLVKEARDRLNAALELLDSVSLERRQQALLKVEIALGLGLAAHDRVSADIGKASREEG